MSLEPGQPAPPFRGLRTDGEEVTLDSYRGKKLVLYFYPKDSTPGCTKEACNFRDHLGEIRAAGAEVLGVSTDSVSSHERFTRKHDLNFPLLADPDQTVAKAYGAWGGIGAVVGVAKRKTFLIDEEGKLAHVWHRVNPFTHAQEVLARLAS